MESLGRRSALGVATTSTLALALPTAASRAAGKSEPVEPRAGSWKTWVVRSGAELSPLASPDAAATGREITQLKELTGKRDAAAKDLIAWWDTGAPSYRWHEIALAETLRANMGGAPAARLLALVHVAIYDAMVATWASKYAHGRKRPSEVDATLSTVLPNPPSPSYPSGHAAAAGAAAAVLSYVFPDRAQMFAQKAEEAGRSRMLGGVNYPSDVAAGFDLGRRVAALVIERGKADGSDAKWTGTVPSGADKWFGTNPLGPAFGTWKTWILSSPGEFRPGPPLPHDSSERGAELAELRNFKRTPKTNSEALFWEAAVGGPRGHQYWSNHLGRLHFEYGLNGNSPRAARAYAIWSVVYYDVQIACWEAKYIYWDIRPMQLDPEIKPLFNTPNHPSYPSAGATIWTAAAVILGHLFPRDAAALSALADEGGQSRIAAGIHYRSDVVAGNAMGRAVAGKMIERARDDGAS
ncbi:phosphatase PAP2 family protein [Vineibacter terrae]|uniref:Phosphatase PAP2 family protein n=1 Tax=Vineibacter terrae TaxID=2586908 RepID=A0A5C8PVE5_9HYPH|nr:phosphatase PAP2 family protein [Vineibacter terrae]TXL81985.1 phosphatase PAP2 family protein [Vineibacter terrae]